MKKNLLLLLSFLFLAVQAWAADGGQDEKEVMEAEELKEMLHYMDSVESTLTYETGAIQLGEDIATLQVPEGYKYLNSELSEHVLTNLWGNPPQESLGMLFPEESSVFDDTYVINISYVEDGYVSDEDAAELDYDELLETMKEGAEESNQMRTEQGYETVNLVGWASEPFYDAETKKLHWAKELKFGHTEDHVLNYNIRVLGRKGYLELNFISNMNDLEVVKKDMPVILPSINFNEGYKYSEFNPGLDKVAAYGIGGLIAGKLLAKTGILAGLLKFSKVIIVGAVALVGGIFKKFFGRKDA